MIISAVLSIPAEVFTSDLTPGLLQSIATALITLLVPVAVVVFAEKENFFSWDRNVILDRVICARAFLWYLLLLYAPVFFWNFDHGHLILRVILFALYSMGLFGFFDILKRAFLWSRDVDAIESGRAPRGYRSKLREEFLDSLSDENEAEKVWLTTWSKKLDNTVLESMLVQKFCKYIKKRLDERKTRVVARELQSFNAYFNLRSTGDWTIAGDLISKALEWHEVITKIQEDDGIDDDEYGSVAANVSIHALIKLTFVGALKTGSAYVAFSELEKHLQNIDTQRSQQLLHRSICVPFFNNVAVSKESYDIWGQYFPDEWKITKTTLMSDSSISRIWLVEFLDWYHSRLLQSQSNEKVDLILDEVARELFPDTEPITWAAILTFVSRPWVNEERMKALVESSAIFGVIGRMVTSFQVEDIDKVAGEIYEAQYEATIELALYVFSHQLNRRTLMETIEGLKHVPDSSDGVMRRKEKYFRIFSSMLRVVERSKS